VILKRSAGSTAGADLSANVDLLVGQRRVEAEMMCSLAVTSLSAANRSGRRYYPNKLPTWFVTAGGLGLAVAERGKTTYAEAAHTVKLVDTHGAGDAFIGALAARWASGVPVAEAVRFANAAAALFVSTPADQKKAVTSDQVIRFLSERR